MNGSNDTMNFGECRTCTKYSCLEDYGACRKCHDELNFIETSLPEDETRDYIENLLNKRVVKIINLKGKTIGVYKDKPTSDGLKPMAA